MGVPADGYMASLPRKRVAATVLFFDEVGRVLVVEPTYKPYWELPGGAVEADESPYAGACREVREELGRTAPVGRLLAVDWVPARPDRTECVTLVFDGGVLPAAEVAALRVPPDELRGLAWCTVDEAAGLLPPLLARRLASACRARDAGVTGYLENGSAPAHQVPGGLAPAGDAAGARSGGIGGGVAGSHDSGDGDVVG